MLYHQLHEAVLFPTRLIGLLNFDGLPRTFRKIHTPHSLSARGPWKNPPPNNPLPRFLVSWSARFSRSFIMPNRVN